MLFHFQRILSVDMNSQVSEQIMNWLDSKKEEMLSFLENLVKAESPSKDPGAHLAAQLLLTEKLESVDFQVTKINGLNTGGHLFARPIHRSKGTPLQLLLGHSDTVWPLDTLEKMNFSIDDGKIKGPGVYDMKAGLTQIIFSLKLIKDLGLPLSVDPVVFINSDEEIGSRESTKYIKWLSNICERAYVLEPPLGLRGKLKTARKGLGRFTIEVTGREAHAGLDPTKGASAILELSHQIQNLFAMNDYERGITVNVGLIEGGQSANVIAGSSKAVIDARVPTMKDAKELTDKINALQPSSPEYKINITGAFGRPPMEETEENRKLWELAKKEGKKLGLELEDAKVGGGSDGNTTSQFTATLDGLGTTGDGAHAIHEFAFVEHLIERTALLTLLILADSVKE